MEEMRKRRKFRRIVKRRKVSYKVRQKFRPKNIQGTLAQILT
jgi:hypothetical protein